MKKRLTAALLAGLFLGGASLALASERHPVHYEYAEVVDARPVIRTVRVPSNREVCWDERVHHVERPDTTGSTLVGGIIGGVIGNQFGKGSGRRAATAAGAVIGGSVGHANASQRGERHYTTSQERCRLDRGWVEEQEVIGYDVDYSYQGRIYSTRMNHHPGDELRIRVSATPAG